MTTILIVIGAIIGLVLILTLLAGKEMNIQRSVTINKSAQQIFEYVRFSKNHDNFSIWNMMDPDMKKEYQGTDGQIGFIYSWDSNKNKNVGAGEQETKILEQDKLIEYELRFSRPMQNTSIAKFIFTSISANETNVQWGIYGPTKFPMSLLKPIFQSVLGKALDSGLQNLKAVMEKQ